MLQNNELEQSDFPIWRLVITEAQFPSNTCHGGRFTYGNANQNRRTGHTISHTTFALAFWRSLYSSTESFIKKGTTNHSYLKGTIWHFSVYLVEWYFPFLYLKINIKALKCLAIVYLLMFRRKFANLNLKNKTFQWYLICIFAETSFYRNTVVN